MANPATRAETARWIIGELANGYAEVLELMAGSRPETAWEMLASAPAADDPFRWRQPLPPLVGDLYLLIGRPDAVVLGRQIMLAAGVDDATTDELHSTFIESAGQMFSLGARAMTARLASEVRTPGGEEIAEFPPDTLWASVQVTLGESKTTFYLGLPPTLADELELKPAAHAAAASAGASSSAPSTSSPSLGSPPNAATESKTFELLLDVTMPVSVSFGHAYVPLRDVLKLTTGSIVELSRAIVEPVDVVVNNRVIAHGEVVVVEGNFGVRIQHVVSRSDRLRSFE